ncbi:hypothetical protein HYALB_00005793 [Hymenoscyphus albidus]|uniref:TLC domain-containing protein n=1 Tax=Hymenoscyphus albidus TaxID=595503 RepID=A0A9N9Q2D1_9HELO|nr:hypothetical protein HYALB_00005793 [Hymenoscyphus albidus]
MRSQEIKPILRLNGVYMANKPPNTRWDICCHDGNIQSIVESTQDLNSVGTRFVAPGLCHPHIHLDKCFLLSHPKYSDLQTKRGDFAEAMKLTSEAKARFEHDDLMERGQALIEESVKFGVTHMRAFVEVDPAVGMKCLDAGLALKKQFSDTCYIQICVFAQDPIFSGKNGGEEMLQLLNSAAAKAGVEVFGSTPYVEDTKEHQKQNIRWATMIAQKHRLNLDFHLDYNLDSEESSMVPCVLEQLRKEQWPSTLGTSDSRTVVLGHCTRLTPFSDSEWLDLRKEIGDFPISFVGLPTSDLFMMGRPKEGSDSGERVRGTLQIPQLIKQYGLNAAIGTNNVGNAFTPHGSCDPLILAGLGVGIYQAGTKDDAGLLLQCVTSRARNVIGLNSSKANDMALLVGSPADLEVFGHESKASSRSFRARKTTQDIVNDAGYERTIIFQGKMAIQPFADYTGLVTLPLHIHEVLGSFLAYYFINVAVAPWISRKLFPVKYAKLSPDRKINWDVHVVSLCQSTVINVLALWVMHADEERKNMNALERVWGYTGAAGMIQGMAAGYFLWDLVVTLQNVRLFGLGMLAHAMSALIVFSFGFRPFVNFYGCTFILYELSSPLLNFHWFFDKLDMTGSKAQLYNGIMLLATFFSCRLVWGTYQSVRVYQDVWAAVHHQSAAASIHLDALNNGTAAGLDAATGHSAAPIHSEMMRFAGEEYVPLWLAFTYLGSNIILNTLNFYWFGKMIETVRKRFQPPKEERRKLKTSARSTANGKVKIDLDETDVRRRNVGKEEPIAIEAIS